MMDDVTNGRLCNTIVCVLGPISVEFPDVFVNKIDKLMTIAKTKPITILSIAKVVGSVGQINEVIDLLDVLKEVERLSGW